MGGSQANRGAQRGHNQYSGRGLGRGQDPNRGSKRPYDHGQRSHRGSGRGSDQRQRGGRPSKSHLYAEKRYCVLCKERGHNNLINCPKFPNFIPRGTNVIPVPKEVCLQCLSTAGQPTSCTHQYPADYKDWLCNTYKVNFALCKTCPKHQGPQDVLKANFNAPLGRSNLTNAYKECNYDSALINSIQVQPSNQSVGIADIEELDEGDTAYVNAVLVNQLRIGKACTPFEVIKVKTATGYYPIVLIYDTGAQVSLCNYETGPVLIQSKQADRRVTISTKGSSTAKLRRIHTLDLGEGHNMDAILIPKLRLNLRTIDIPETWQDLDDTFADQDYYNVQAQILVGADKYLCLHIIVIL